jgi:ABC-type phosphate transport system permease subunit
MEETVFFTHGDVKVTNARFISGGQTFAMSNITSVKPIVEEPNRGGGILVLLVGLLLLWKDVTLLGLLFIIGAGLYLYSQKTIYHVVLSTSAGESKALLTYQRDYLNQVISALNQAIISRG